MTIIFEVAGPFQRRPFYFASELMFRVGWAWFAVAVLRVRFERFCTTPQRWAKVVR